MALRTLHRYGSALPRPVTTPPKPFVCAPETPFQDSGNRERWIDNFFMGVFPPLTYSLFTPPHFVTQVYAVRPKEFPNIFYHSLKKVLANRA